jgi:hypothetical protein
MLRKKIRNEHKEQEIKDYLVEVKINKGEKFL